MKIYAIRHGLTELNKKGIINGRIPDELAPEGKEQARLAASNLPASITHIYSSPLKRARQTTDILNAQLQLPVTYHDELQEVSFGDLDGTPFTQEVKRKHIAFTYDWRPSGESVDDVKQRVLKIVKEIKQQSGDGEALLVVHGGIIRMLLFLEHGEIVDEIDNAGLFEFDVDKILANA